MTNFTLRSRSPRGLPVMPVAIRDADVLGSHLEDAAHFPGGHAAALFAPASEAEVVEILRASRTVLPIGAQSSLTGGATPRGDVLISTRRLNRIQSLKADRIRVQA